METNYKVKHRRILMPLKLVLLLVAMVLFGVTSFAQQSKTIKVSNDQQLLKALENPSVQSIVFDASYYGIQSIDNVSKTLVSQSPSGNGNRANDCVYFIQENDVCFDPVPPATFVPNSALAGTVDPFLCGCCPPANIGTWSIIDQPLGSTLNFLAALNMEAMPFEVDMPGVYTLRYSWGMPYNSYVQTEYYFFGPYNLGLTSMDVCGLTTTAVNLYYTAYGNANYEIDYFLVNTCTNDTLPFVGPVFDPNGDTVTFDITVPDYGLWEFCAIIEAFDTIFEVCPPEKECIYIDFAIEPNAYAGEDAEICEDFCYELMGSAGSMFAYTCYQSANFAYTWVQVSGPGAWQLIFDNANEDTTEVCRPTGCSYGMYEVAFQVTNGACYDADTMVLYFYEQPTADAGDDISLCFDDGCFSMGAVPYGYCSGPIADERSHFWTQLSGPATLNFVDMYDPETDACPDPMADCIYGFYEVMWTEINGTCFDYDTVQITLYEQPTAIAGDDAWYCMDKEFSMELWHTFDATPYEYCQEGGFEEPFGYWSKCGGPGDVVFNDENDPATSVLVSAFGCYCFEWVEVNGDCEDRDTVEVCFYEHPYLEGENLVDSLCSDDLCFDLGQLGVMPYEYLPAPNVNYDVQSWYQISGVGTAVFTDPDAVDTEVCVDTYGCYTFGFIQYNGDPLCADTITADLWFFEQPMADAGDDAAVCAPCYTMQAVPYSFSDVNDCHPDYSAYWTLIGYVPPDTFCGVGYQYYPCVEVEDWEDPNTMICVCEDDYIGMNYGTYIFVWTEINGTCMDTDTVEITFNKQPDPLPLTGCTYEDECSPYGGGPNRELGGDLPCGCVECVFPEDTVLTVCAGDCAYFSIFEWAPTNMQFDEYAPYNECLDVWAIPGYTYEWSFTGPSGSFFEADPLWYDCSCDEWKGDLGVEICFGECCDTARLYLTITSPEGCVTTEEWKFYVQHPPDATISGPEVAEVSSVFEYSIPDPANECYLYIWSVQHCGEIVYGQGTGTIGVHWTDYNQNGGWGLIYVEVYDTCTCCCNTDSLLVRVLPQGSLGSDTLQGYVYYNNMYSTPLNGVKLTLWNSGVPIFETYSFNDIEGGNGVGYYAFEGISGTTNFGLSAEHMAPWYGANATDALAVELQVTLPTWVNPVQIEAGDVNGSGAMSATDALWIKQRAIAMVNHFPAGDWAFEPNMTTMSGSYDVYTLNYGDVVNYNIPNSNKEMPAITMVTDGMINVVPGEVFELPVRVADAVSIGAITLQLGYNSSLLEVVEVMAVEGALSNVTPSHIAMAWSNVNPLVLNNNDAFVTLRLKALGPITTSDLMFTIEQGTEFADPTATVIEDMTLKTFGISTDPAATDYFLSYNRPNPFSNSTQIEYTLPESGKVRLSVVDLLGQEIEVLVNQSQSAGSYTVQYNAAGVAPGVYIYKITVQGESRDFVETRRMVISQ